MADIAMPAGTPATRPTSTDDLFTAAYRKYAPMVRNVILSRMIRRDDHLADDLTQNVFLALFRIRNRYDMARDLGGLLHVMARQSVSHHFRVFRNTREVPADTGHWAYANRALAPAAGGTLKPLDACPGDSDPDPDEALRRVRESKPRALVGAR
jgi:DNA-directed RNA polymerase specialized sigma24 family protein